MSIMSMNLSCLKHDLLISLFVMCFLSDIICIYIEKLIAVSDLLFIECSIAHNLQNVNEPLSVDA